MSQPDQPVKRKRRSRIRRAATVLDVAVPDEIVPPPAPTKQSEALPVLTSPQALANLDPLMQLVSQGADIDTIKELVTLYREERAYKAQEAFDTDFAAFQSECPPVRHDGKARFSTRNGGFVEYSYSTLAAIAAHVAPWLHRRGFSYAWDIKIEGGNVTAVCVLRHRAGHSRSAPFTCPLADNNPLPSKAQLTKGAQTFAQRCSLISVLGLSTTDTDVDGAADDVDAQSVTITEDQIRDLECLLAETGSDRARFLACFDVETLDDMHVANYIPAVRLLEARRKEVTK